MHLRTKVIGSILISTFVLATLAGAGTRESRPKVKLPAPTNVMCAVVAGTVNVTWDLVPTANAYQVEHFGMLTDGQIVHESDFVLTSPAGIEDDDFALLAVHVRAIPAPKREGRPLQSGSPKGLWSEACVVSLTTP
jgi:hypothetical protein